MLKGCESRWMALGNSKPFSLASLPAQAHSKQESSHKWAGSQFLLAIGSWQQLVAE